MTDTPKPAFGTRPPLLPLRRGAVDFTDEAGVAYLMQLIGDAEIPPVESGAGEPFVGVTTDGKPIPELFAQECHSFNPAAAVRAATAYLDGLKPEMHARALLPMDAPEWRLWSNAFLTFAGHGLLLQDLSQRERDSAMAVIEATLSEEGFGQLRTAMSLNGRLGEFTHAYGDTLTEWCYWFTIFGDAASTGSGVWGWQLMGHHIDLHCAFVGSRLVATPAFLGCEFHADEVFSPHRDAAREFMASLTVDQQAKSLLYGSMVASELPPELAGIADGRHRAGAGRDNLVLPYSGVRGDELVAGQRDLLRSMIEPYLRPLPEEARRGRRASLEAHLDDTHVAWIGGWDEDSPFYYRVHSPVVLIEYDNHPGIFLDNDQPEPYHVHTIVRTPNGGDYGKDLLRRHYASDHGHISEH